MPVLRDGAGNEQVIDGHCERCASAVERQTMNQWYFRITDYRDRLIAGLDRIDMPDSTKRMQRAWLAELGTGASHGSGHGGARSR